MRSLESSDRTVNMLYSILMLSNGPIFRYAKKYTKSDLCSAMSGFVAAIVIFLQVWILLTMKMKMIILPNNPP